MELKPGYKPTEVGVIPEDWKMSSLSELGDIRSGGTPSTSKSEFWDGGIPWCTPTDITALKGRKYLHETSRTISDNGLRSSSAEIIPTRSLIMTSRATIGECAINVLPMTTNQGFKNIVPFDCLDIEYLYYVMTTQKSRLVSLCGGSTFLEIGKKQLVSFQIKIPKNRAEQQAIATALSDVDALLVSLDQLITKKRNIKQAAMQELLTGKTRLPGFHKNWEVKPLRKISAMFGRIGWQGLKQSEFTDNSDDPFLITGTDFRDTSISWDSAYHVTQERYDIAPQIQLHPDDVLMTKDGTIGKILYVENIPYPCKATLNSHLLVFRPIGHSYIPRFLYYQMLSRRFAEHIAQNKSGSTFFGLSQEATGRYLVLLPSVEEQTAIAQVLSDIDADIDALEQRRKKIRDLKQAMMQELLTGKTRLL